MINGKFDEHLITNDAERLYLYRNSTQIEAQTGFQGYLHGDFSYQGNRFNHEFFPRHSQIDAKFPAALDVVMGALRTGILKSYSNMKSFCQGKGKESRFSGKWSSEYGLRINHSGYSFMLRLIPQMGDYHVYCFGYITDWLDRHMRDAERGIRFIDQNYNELFRLQDGGRILVRRSGISGAIPGAVSQKICRYIDDYHVQIGNSIYHICEFAEYTQNVGTTVTPYAGIIEVKK